ncbi:MAG: glycosyltransferase [Chthonomonadales bacterium]|nr:glycosyltransferase [Chthonomonadales bacterium]
MAGAPLRVLLVSPLPPPVGGIATWTRILLREIACDPGIAVEHLDTAVRWRAVTQISAPARLLGGTAQALRDYLRFRSILRSITPDVVHICTSAGYALRKDLLMLRAAASRGVRAIIHYRMGRIPALAQSQGGEWDLLRQCTATAHTSVVLDRRSMRALREACPAADVRSLPNMVDLMAVDGVLGGLDNSDANSALDCAVCLVYVGHVLPSKGVTDLVEACRLTGLRLRLEVVGPAEDAYCRELASRSGDHTTLIFHGTLSHEEALETLRRGNVFVLPSHSEGFPNVVAEAMACARPVLATDVGAMPEMLDAESAEPCGICVEAKNPAALADAITLMAGDAGLRAAMGARGRRRAETEYAAPVVTRRLTELWREVAALSG